MPPSVITVSGLSKQYRITARRERYRTVRDVVGELIARPLRMLRRGDALSGGARESMIWALKDVSFDVRQGEVVGIIGRNGAGKSTLLKVVSAITCPTEGRVEICGRVGSLLEVGTGFHPELTGRENVFLNGAILGMKRAEIKRKFDEIVAFAEVEKFIDTPVKRYSSGMSVRLAFAVAAHLEPEILLVDEVLAVGDLQFQKKCMGKMNDVARTEGRTILFVSHNLAAVQELCQRTVVLDRGGVHCIRESSEACEEYVRLLSGSREDMRQGIVRGGHFELRGVRVEGEHGRLPAPLEPADFVIPVCFEKPCTDPRVHLLVQTSEGETVFGLGSTELDPRFSRPAAQDFEFRFRVEQLPLLPGPHNLVVKVRSDEHGINEMLHLDYRFDVAEAPVYGTARIQRRWHGLVPVVARLTVTPGS